MISFFLVGGLNFRLLDWRPDKLRGERFRHERVVIIKNMFDPKQFEVGQTFRPKVSVSS